MRVGEQEVWKHFKFDGKFLENDSTGAGLHREAEV